MKNVVSFLLFVSYATCIFFFPNNQFVALCIIVNLLLMVLLRRSPKRIFVKCMNILPFVLFTFVVNCILDNISNAFWIGIKLMIVCHITIVYSETKSVR